MDPEVYTARYNQLTSKIEALIREYGDVIPRPHDEDCDCPDYPPPDWSHPLALQHWVLIFAIDDTNPPSPDGISSGYWTFEVTPLRQPNYISRGLIEEWKDLL